MRILQNQTSGLLQLILYKRHGKVVGDTLFFERLTQGVTEEAHALSYDLSVRYFYGSQPTDEQICAIQSEPFEALLRFGYRIPQDVSVIGFDDSSISTTLTPPLTTVQVQKQRLGALAVDRLHTRLQKNVPETQTLKQKEYVNRNGNGQPLWVLPVLHALLSVLVYRTEWEIENTCGASNCSYKRNVNRCIPMLRKEKVASKV